MIENPGFKPIIVEKGNCLTADLARQLLKHNEFGEKLKYWKSSKGCIQI